MRLETTQLKEGASSLGSSNLYQSYFVCVTEDTVNKATTIQYGKTPDNEVCRVQQRRLSCNFFFLFHNENGINIPLAESMAFSYAQTSNGDRKLPLVCTLLPQPSPSVPDRLAYKY